MYTGATCNVVGERNSCSTLMSFGGGRIKSVGRITAAIRHGSVKFDTSFEVVTGEHMPLLSWKSSLRLGFIKICAKIEGMSIIKQFNDVFSGLGRFEGNMTLEVSEGAKPVSSHVPVAMVDSLKLHYKKSRISV